MDRRDPVYMDVLRLDFNCFTICHPWQLDPGQPSLRSPYRDDGYWVWRVRFGIRDWFLTTLAALLPLIFLFSFT
jgi:hypothetical protein